MEDNDPAVAIVGMACRLPGAVNSPLTFWDLIKNGVQTWSDVPEDRFNWAAHLKHDSTSNSRGQTTHRGGHFLSEDIKSFDAEFFSVAPIEAQAMDPQVRLLLEIAFEAFENAGMTLDEIRGSNTAVYMASFNDDYSQLSHADAADTPMYSGIGVGDAMLSNRISYQFDLKGPSLTINTGCSGSLVAFHAACQALRNGDADMALVGGANLMLTPDTSARMSRLGMLNADGRSYSFDHRGSGYGRGEGIAAVVIKRVEDAQRDNCRIDSIVRAVGVGQDGATKGITQPSSEAQEALIRKLYARAHLDPSETTYIEAHGTGTIAGDLAELSALERVFGQDQRSVSVGTVKSNIGHLESVSGIVGLIKAVLVLQNAEIPPIQGLQNLKSGLEPFARRLNLPRACQNWPEGRLRRASVNSFGYGGTNAHAIIEHPALYLSSSRGCLLDAHNNGIGTRTLSSVSTCNNTNDVRLQEDIQVDGEARNQMCHWRLFNMSGASQKSLLGNIRLLHSFASKQQSHHDGLETLSNTLANRRSPLRWRTTFVCDSWSSLASATAEVPSGRKVEHKSWKVTLMFTGQGSQYYKMGWELYQTNPQFRSSLKRSQTHLLALGAQWDLLTVLFSSQDEDAVNAPEISQPAVTALQIALVDMLKNVNLPVDTIVGHSSGEIAAAYAARALTYRDALCVAYHRGRLASKSNIHRKHDQGAMMAVATSEDQILSQIEDLHDVMVACVNSPSSVTLSGSAKSMDQLAERLKSASPKVLHRLLKVNVAYHSSAMDSIAAEYLESIQEISSSPIRDDITFVSSVTKREVKTFEPSYWVDNLVNPVRFKEAVEFVLNRDSTDPSQHQGRVFIEVGPHSVLCPLARQTRDSWVKESQSDPSETPQIFDYIPVLTRGKDSCQALHQFLGSIWERGLLEHVPVECFIPIDMLEPLIHFPPYAWDHMQKFWLDNRLVRNYLFPHHRPHELLGQLLPTSNNLRPVWRSYISKDSPPWIKDHVVHDTVILPASAYIVMAAEAHYQHFARIPSSFHFRTVQFRKPLVLPQDGKSVEVNFALEEMDNRPTGNDTWKRFSISSSIDGREFTENCSGLLCSQYADVQSSNNDEVADLKQFVLYEAAKVENYKHQNVDGRLLYADLRTGGNSYGPSFQVIENMIQAESQWLAYMTRPSTLPMQTSKLSSLFILDPQTLDGCIQACVPASFTDIETSAHVAASIEQLSLFASSTDTFGSQSQLLILNDTTSTGSSKNDFHLLNQRDLAIYAHGLVLKRSQKHAGQNGLQPCSYSIVWQPDYSLSLRGLLQHVSDDHLMPNSSSLQEKTVLADSASSAILSAVQNVAPDLIRRPELKIFYRWMQQQSFQIKSEQAPTRTDLSSCDFKTFQVEAEMLKGMIPNVEPILLGQKDVLQVLTDDDLLFRFYSGQSFLPLYRRVRDFVRNVGFKEGGLNILEIGGGTGAFTNVLLDDSSSNRAWPFVSEYDFTDISPGFLEKAQSRFPNARSKINYRIFDMNKDPLEQGYEEGKYNLIIASNVIHHANLLENTLHFCRRLLKQGGHFIMLETSVSGLFGDFVFGGLSGWWDDNLKPPLMPVTHWIPILSQCGFNYDTTLSSSFTGMAEIELIVANKNIQQEETALPSITASMIPSAPDRHQALLDIKISLENAIGGIVLHEIPDQVDAEQVYVILDSYETPIFLDQSSSTFLRIVQLLLRAQKVIWITTSTSITAGSEMESGVITGLARSARTENTSLKMSTINIIDLDNQDQSFLQNSLCRLYKFLARSFQNGDVFETEYVIRSNEILIPRLIPETDLQNALSEKTLLKRPGTNGPGSNGFHEVVHRFYEYVSSSHRESVTSLRMERFRGSTKVEVEAWLCFPDEECYMPTIACIGRVIGEAQMGKQQPKKDARVYVWGNFEMSNEVVAFPDQIEECPENYSLSEQMMLLSNHGILYYSLKYGLSIEPNDIMLIYSRSSDIVRAARDVGLLLGVKVFLLVDKEAPQALEGLFNQDRILDTSSPLLRYTISGKINNGGLPFVISTNVEELPRDVLSALSHHQGGLLHFDCHPNIDQGWLTGLHPNITVVSIRPDSFLRTAPTQFKDAIRELVTEVKQGRIQMSSNIPILTQESLEKPTSSSTRLLDGEVNGLYGLSRNIPATVESWLSQFKSVYHRNATYMIVGGLGGLGKALCKHMVSQGAGHVLLLTRRDLSDTEKERLIQDLSPLTRNVSVAQCNPANRDHMVVLKDQILPQLPPLRGVVQAAMHLEDSLLKNATQEKWISGLESKVEATIRLIELVPDGKSLDFFLMLSSAVSILGTMGQSPYVAGNTFMDNLATFMCRPDLNLISLGLGLIIDSSRVTSNPLIEKNLKYQGFMDLRTKHFIRAVDHLLRRAANGERLPHTVIGLNTTSLFDKFGKQLTSTPILRHALKNEKSKPEVRNKGNVPTRSDLESMQDPCQIQPAIREMLIEQIASATFIEKDKLDTSASLGDMGVDSLMGALLSNWVNSTFEMRSKSLDHIESCTISLLAKEIMDTSSILKHMATVEPTDNKSHSQPGTNGTNPSIESNTQNNKVSRKPDQVALRQPIPDLQQTVQSWLDLVALFTEQKAFHSVEAEAKKFVSQQSLGPAAQKHLVDRYADPSVDNWVADSYLIDMEMKRRTAMVPFRHYFRTHCDFAGRTQAHRAAVISHAALEWMHAFETGRVEVEVLAGKPQSTALYHLLGHASVEPGATQDQLVTHPSNDEIVVLHRGKASRLSCSRDSGDQKRTLEKAFQQLIDDEAKTATDSHWPGILTSEERGKWAKSFEELRSLDLNNQTSIDAIERAAFIVCLDDQKFPELDNRLQHFLWGSQNNRWNDKSVQFIVTEDGHSAAVYHHTFADGVTILPFHRAVTAAIVRDQDEPQDQNGVISGDFKAISLLFTLPPSVKTHIDTFTPQFQKRIAQCSQLSMVTEVLNGKWLSSRRLHRRCSVNLVLEIANRRFWGYDRPVVETVAMSHFRGGRVDLHQLVSPESIAFHHALDAAKSNAHQHNEHLRTLFRTAIKAQTRNLALVTEGNGPIIYLRTLQYILQNQGINVPFLETPEAKLLNFAPLYVTTWTEDAEDAVTTHSGNICESQTTALKVHSTVSPDRVSFNLWGLNIDTVRFAECVEFAVKLVHDLFMDDRL